MALTAADNLCEEGTFAPSRDWHREHILKEAVHATPRATVTVVASAAGIGGPVDDGRRLRIAMAIVDAARTEGAPVRLHHVCQAAPVVIGVCGASLSVLGDLGFGEVVCASDGTSAHIAELETILGVGPANDVLTDSIPTLAADLSSPRASHRWPRLAALVSPLGVTALFAFPLTGAEETVGVLELYRRRPGPLTPSETADAEAVADAAMEMLVRVGRGAPGYGDGQLFGPLDAQWGVINQAVAVVSAELHSGMPEAYLRLRAHAFLTDCRLLPLAEAVLTGDLRFTPDNWG
jgi:hypothetical protein